MGLETSSTIIQTLIDNAGATTQSLGMGRVIGKIFAYLYFSESPRCMADMQRDLNISKGSASMNIRQLQDWSAVKKIDRPEQRKDFYVASDAFGRILKNAVADLVSAKMAAYRDILQEVQDELASVPDSLDEKIFLAERLARLDKFHDRVATTWDNPLVKALLR
ncbi:MAG: hypothetical protein RRC34_08625 [Lentisphaeria bacterium]|nr:hypothetical protein [Lentisphaeria bacterium]